MASTAKASRCPTCKGAVEKSRAEGNEAFPFCCERCRLADLGKWLDGDYVIPGPPSFDEDGEMDR
jgi:endogenous inhibitor of DNA gyrase (YacG/DUF329 family)